MLVTREYLELNPNHIFVFGDNTLHKGKAGAAALRDCHNTYGFITKKLPCNQDSCFYHLSEYETVYWQELDKLIRFIESNPDKTFLISKLGAGLANRFSIFDFIETNLKLDLSEYSNVEFLW